MFLEFRASKPWNLSTPSVDNLKAVTATLWEAMDMGGRFMDNAALHRDVLDFGKKINFFHKLSAYSYIFFGPGVEGTRHIATVVVKLFPTKFLHGIFLEVKAHRPKLLLYFRFWTKTNSLATRNGAVHRLFIGTRKPAETLTLPGGSGNQAHTNRTRPVLQGNFQVPRNDSFILSATICDSQK